MGLLQNGTPGVGYLQIVKIHIYVTRLITGVNNQVASGTREYGVMAHELQSELPYLVSGKKDEVDENGQPQIQRVNYAKLVPILLRAIQEQQEMINELSQEVNAIKQSAVNV